MSHNKGQLGHSSLLLLKHLKHRKYSKRNEAVQKEVSNFILLHLVPWYRTTLLRLCCVYLCICVFVYLCVFVFVYLSIWYQTTLFWLRAYLCVFDATWWLVACCSRVQLNSSLIMRPDNNRGDTMEGNFALWFLRGGEGELIHPKKRESLESRQILGWERGTH